MTAGTAAMRLLRGLFLAVAFVLAAAGTALGAPSKKNPGWGELNQDQQRILAPLEKTWDELSADRKRKWLDVSRRYPKMTPTGKTRVQRRMEAWVKLTPEQRRQARENYRKITKLPAQKKGDLQQEWLEYQSLSPEERRKLRAQPADAKPKERKPRTKKPQQDTAPSPRTQAPTEP